ncbi:2-amino-4-hydroxy-6-hydroxymethyldihydropteridine diphosphokinase [Mycobacterium xenopi 3993]|nr:2-amino-4-hydroxy-6-hydroxymethyldihydropteridine diphosphokinase [Mycobacterium xenopi 3993]
MTRVVLSIGSNLGDRLARLQSVVDGLAGRCGPSLRLRDRPVGRCGSGPFLNAVLIADDPACDGHGWLRRPGVGAGADRTRGQRWGPRTLDVDLIACYDDGDEVLSRDDGLTLPHPLAHLRAFVMVRGWRSTRTPS